MLATMTTASRMAQKLGEAMSSPPLKQAEVAVACGVTKQAVQGWLKTGRFDKKHLPTLAKVTGRPLAWWLDAETDTPSDDLLNALQDWRLQASSKSQEVIDTLTLLAKKNKLRDEDWLLIQQMVHRVVQSSPIAKSDSIVGPVLSKQLTTESRDFQPGRTKA